MGTQRKERRRRRRSVHLKGNPGRRRGRPFLTHGCEEKSWPPIHAEGSACPARTGRAATRVLCDPSPGVPRSTSAVPVVPQVDPWASVSLPMA